MQEIIRINAEAQRTQRFAERGQGEVENLCGSRRSSRLCVNSDQSLLTSAATIFEDVVKSTAQTGSAR